MRFAGLTPPAILLAAVSLCLALVARPVPPVDAAHQAVVLDASGKPGHIDPRGRGVVLLDPLVGEYMIGSRAPRSLQSIGSWNLGMVRASPLAAIFPALLRLPDDDLWRYPNIERLLALRPTAVIPYTPLRQARAVGLPVVRFETLGEPHWWLDNAPTAARLTGQPERADQLRTDYQEDMANLQRALPAPSVRARAPSLLVIAPHSDHTLGALHNRIDPFLETVGARDPAFLAGQARLNAEALLRLDPDILVLERTSDATPAAFMADPRWRGLKAVRNRRVYARPPGLAFTTTGILEYPFYARWIAELLYPEQMAPQLRDVMRCDYRRTLGYEMSEAQLGQLLAVALNRTSNGYARFERDTRAGAGAAERCPPPDSAT